MTVFQSDRFNDSSVIQIAQAIFEGWVLVGTRAWEETRSRGETHVWRRGSAWVSYRVITEEGALQRSDVSVPLVVDYLGLMEEASQVVGTGWDGLTGRQRIQVLWQQLMLRGGFGVEAASPSEFVDALLCMVSGTGVEESRYAAQVLDVFCMDASPGDDLAALRLLVALR